MNQYLLYGAIGVGCLLLALLVPGVKVLAELILKGLITISGELLKHKATFWVWFIKTLTADHSRVFKHATQKRDEIDPTQKIRRSAEGYDD